ncbi:MAG: HAD-IIA family hydrolase [Candidatus Thorarchaeota archaeon]|jgi:4-nitrophenyl phosphatase/NagD protein
MTELHREVHCFLFDMDGTIYLGDKLLPGALEFLGDLDERKVPYYFLTNNSSRSRADYVKKLDRLGLKIPAEKIFSSGEATAIYLKKHGKGKRIYMVGTPSLEKEFVEHGFQLVQEDPDYAVLGFDTTLTYEKLWKLCDFARERIPYIATHPDINCPTQTGFMPDIGAMIAFVKTSTGRQPDVIVGKPYPPIIEAIVEKTGFSVDQLAMVGDRLYTDIAMGETGITTILVLSGETKKGDVESADHQPDYVVENIQGLRELYFSL